MKASYRIMLFSLATAIALCVGTNAEAAPKTIWQIGKFDQSPNEFNTGKQGPPLFGSRYPAGKLLYVVGKSTPEVDWPAYQEGSTTGKAGSSPHVYTIQFDLPEAPQGVYTLKVGLFSVTSRLALLQIEINGHGGPFYQHPKLNYSESEVVADTITLDFPARFLQKGTNKLALAAIADSPPIDNQPNAAIAYDALELDQDSASQFPTEGVTTEVVPTVFYVRRGDNLEELVDVYVRHNAAVQHGQVTLAVRAQKFNQELSGREFGEQRVEFSLPEFTSGTKGEVTVKINSRSQRDPVV